MSSKPLMPFIRKWSRILHRDLSYFFAGVILIYAVSGILLNHKKDFNSDYSIQQKHYRIEGSFPKSREDYGKKEVLALLQPLEEENNYTKHYFPEAQRLKVFLKGGSSLTLDLNTGNAHYESVKKRPLFYALNRLHYNPGKGWTVFSDLFAGSLILITLTGLILVKGPKGLKGRGLIELISGLIIPLIFIFGF